MKQCIIIFFLLLLSALNTEAQTFTVVEKVKTIPGTYSSVSVDNLDNIYLLSASSQLKKLNANGDSIAVFNDIKKFGEATLVDVSNPLKILLYYKNFSTIAVLDGMLNLKNTIDLRKKNIFRVSAVGLAYDGKIWLYDEMDNTLKKIDDTGEVLQKTADFRQIFDTAPLPKKIFDQSQYVYLYDPQQGIYVFDYYGAFKNKIAITGWHNVKVLDKYIFGTDATQFHIYNTTTLKYTEWPVPAAFKTCKQLVYGRTYLYVLDDSGLNVFSTTH